jgi:hypothetical protein
LQVIADNTYTTWWRQWFWICLIKSKFPVYLSIYSAFQSISQWSI